MPEPTKILRIPQYFRNLHRLGEIASVLVKHGFGDLVARLNLISYLASGLKIIAPRSWRATSATIQLPFAARLRLVCEELGPTFIKFAQLIATRPDVFPDSVIREFRKLQDKVPPFNSDQAKSLLEKELGRPLSEVFSHFEKKPLGAASIAQVHRATLLSGAEVVVKVQRPQLDRLIDTDTDILLGLATLLEEHVPESKQFSPFRLVEEFSRSLRLERDFRREAHHMEKFARHFIAEQDLVVPKVYRHLSTKRILVQEFIDGGRIDAFTGEHQVALQAPERRQTVLDCLTRVTLTSIFEHGFFHGDPHPGNLLITNDGRLALIDFGLIGRLEDPRRTQIIIFLVALFQRDLHRVVDSLRENHLFSHAHLDEVALMNELAEVLDLYLEQSLSNLNIVNLISDVFEVVRRHGIKPPPDLLLISRVLTALQYTAYRLDPDFKPIAAIKPYLTQQYWASLSDPARYARYARQLGNEYERFFRDVPRQLRELFKMLPRGDFVLGYRLENYPDISKDINRLVNRIVMTAIGITCVVVGRSLYGSSLSVDTAAYILMGLGAVVLLTVWAAVRRSGGS
jgi:ubiquinone biosynthesis protein